MESDSCSGPNIHCQLSCLGTIVKCMRDPSKCVDDDTCLERILHLIHEVIIWNSDEATKFLNGDDSIFDSSHCILLHSSEYDTPSICFVVRLLGVFSSHAFALYDLNDAAKNSWELCFKTLLDMPLTTDSSQASIQCSWLQTLLDFMSSDVLLVRILESDFDFHRLALLMASSSIYVKQNATKCLCKLLMYVVNSADNCTKAASNFELCGTEKTWDNIIQAAFDTLKELVRNIPMNSLLKISTTCLTAEDGGQSTAVLKVCFPALVDAKKVKIPCEEMFLEKADACEPALKDFLVALYSGTRDLSDEPPLKSELAWELAMRMLTKHPFNKAGYTATLHVAGHRTSYTRQFLDMVVLPLKVALGEKSVSSGDSSAVLEWSRVLQQSLITKSTMATLLGNTINTWYLLWATGKCRQDVEKAGLVHLDLILSCVYDLPKARTLAGHPVLPSLFQNSKVGTAIICCLEKYISDPSLKGRCLRCSLRDTAGTLLELLMHPAADYKVWSVSGNIIRDVVCDRSQCDDHLNDNSKTFNVLLQSIAFKADHLSWEMKDSALELLTSLLESLTKYRDNALFATFRQSSVDFGLPDLARSSTEHSNSFVRASALDACAQFVKCAKQLCDEKFRVSLCENVVKILRNDEEAAARRPAVHTLSACVTHSQSSLVAFVRGVTSHQDAAGKNEETNEIAKAAGCFVETTLDDLDWEVQHNAVQLLANVYDCTRDVEPTWWATVGVERTVFHCRIRVLLTPLLERDNTAVRERVLDLFRALDNCQSSSSVSDDEIRENRKRNSVILELNYLLDDVIYKMNSTNLSYVESVSRDCY